MKLLKQTLSLLLTIAALTVGQSAWAANTWTISSSTSGTYTTFTISRSGDTSKTETVLYRFVGLSAYAGRHFVVAQINGGDIATSQQMSALSGTFTFAATETSKSVTIKEMDADNAAYIFQNGTSRSYKLEVTDQGGFLLKDYTRSFTTGTSVPGSGAFNVKDITIRSGEISVTDAGYAQGYHSMTIDNYFNNAAPKDYFQQVGAQLRMTLTFQCKEVNDGWQYVQIYANQSTSNIDTGAGDGNPGNCSYAKYVAGFEHKDSNADTEYKSYTFPVTSANNNEGADNPWGHGSGYNLHKQIFNNSRASDGRLIIPLDLSSLYVRYNASGSDKDDWVAKNTVAHIQAIDATAPTALDISVAPGYHAKGNTVYVSVAFKEIVTSSNAKLNTNWGTLSYNTGSGSNVLTFKGTIGNSATGSLNITGYSGTITDLAGNNFAGTITGSNLCTLDASYAYTINYDLDGGSVATANPTTYTYETATFTLNNPTRTGYTFDGWTGSNGNTPQTAVTIPIHSHGDKSYTANWTDVWGIAGGANGTEEHPYVITTTAGLDLLAQNVNSGSNEYPNTYFKLGADIAYPHTTDWNDANSTEDNYTAIGHLSKAFCGIFDGDGHTVSGIRINKPSNEYQGLFGRIYGATVKNVTLNDARITGYLYVGGISGLMNYAIIENCLVLNTAITANNASNDACGAVVGYMLDETLNNNHYRNCTVNGTANTTNVGTKFGDVDGVRSVHALTLPDGVTATGESVAIGGTTYYASNTTVTLSYTGTAPEGYIFVGLQVKDANNTDIAVTDNGDGTYTFTMPAADATVPSALVDVWGIAGGANGTEEHPYVITTTAGLDLLATKVNNGSNYLNKYFKLGADIAYDPTALDANGENYTAIGNYNYGFRGTFDGDGHTVSGIRINKTGSDIADRAQGLFGYVYRLGTVQNVILDDAHITGLNQVGGITGDMYSATITNCLVLNTAITATYNEATNAGVISGYYDGTLIANYYHNCTLTKGGTTSTTNIGSGQNSVSDRDGARSVHALTLPADVTAAGESVAIGGTTYYASNTTVTLSYTGTAPEGYIFVGLQVKDADNNDIAVTDNGDGTYTFTMPAEDATVTSTLVDVWGIAGGATGSNSKPYIITTTAGLDLLATKVNNGNGYSDKYFKLGADIAYDSTAVDANGENYTAIGNYNYGFRGSFDGDGHTVSGIRINKTGSDIADRSQGLFGYLYYGTVQNVILDDANITGRNQVGGITGRMYSATITNCLVLNTAITATANGANNAGIISGFYSGSGTLTANYYHNCTLTKGGTTSTTNIGSGQNSVSDRDGARSVHALTLPTGVTAAGESVAIGSTTYYASNTTVTLSLPIIGYILTDVTVNGTPATDNGDRTWSFTMPAADASVSATISEDPNSLVAIVNDGSTATSYYIDATYTTAEAALRAALDDAANADAANASGSTVTLFRDVTLATDNIECMSGTYTLDLNGHSITGSDGVLELGGDAKITLIDGSSAKTGSITDTGSSEAIVMIEGSLNCTGCTISSNLSTGTGVEYLGGTLTLTDCTITGNIALSKETNSSNITLTNCTITGTSYGILRRDGVFLSLTDCTITGNVGIAYMDPPSSGSSGSQSFIGNNTIKGCTYAGILIEGNVKFKNLPHFGTGSDANGCDIASASGIIDFQTPDQSAYYYVPATPITVKAVGWDNYANAYVDREVGAGAGSYTFAINCNHIKSPNTSTTIPIEEVFVSLNSDYIVRTPIYHTSSYNYSYSSTNSSPAQLTKPVVLNDNANNNASTIENFHYEDCAVTLQGRTLYKDGYWNTLCLPLRIDNISNTPLAGAEIRKLESASLENGTLTLNFSNPVTALVAGTPYIIKWTRANDYVDDDAHNLVNPLFSSVCVYDNTDDFTSTDGTVQFKGTYAPINFTDTDQSILFMGADNTLYYPASGAYINACRAYFKLTDPNSQVRSFVLNFGSTDDDEDPTAIESLESRVKSQESDIYYDLQGRKVKNPVKGTIYIHNGKKELLK